jgi:2-C-methyl-D-erythritol 4-phosphate cytidylyltransferase
MPLADTVKVVEDGVVAETLDRARLVAVQTPQAFSAAALRRAHEGGGEGTDDASLVEALGGRVVVVPGEEANDKITTQHDLLVARALIETLA